MGQFRSGRTAGLLFAAIGRTVGVVFAAVILLVSGASAATAFWTEPLDGRLRADLEVLAAHGVIDRTLTTWPVPVAAIASGLRTADTRDLPPYAEQSLFRVTAFVERERRRNRLDLDAELRITSDRPVTIRTFDVVARDNVDAHVSASYSVARTGLKLRAGVISDTDAGDPRLSFDGSQIVQGVGNLLFYAGTVDQWWGPGEVSSLILSNNARPFPKVGVMREQPRPFGWKYLRWLGRWQFNMFVGRLEEERFVAHPLLWGMRLSVAPAQGLEIGLSRVIQLCGEDRPCGAETWAKAFIGHDNASAAESIADQPGNQLAGFDMAYTRVLPGGVVGTVYGQLIGEDEAGGLPSKYGGLAGVSVTGGGPRGSLWKLAVEYTDTGVREYAFAGKSRPNIFYDHFIYHTGYRFEGEAIGHPLDNDGRLLSVLARYMDVNGITYRLEFHHADVNRDGTVRPDGVHSISARAGEFNLFVAEALVPLDETELTFSLRADDVARFDPDADTLTLAGELGLRVRF